MTIKLDPSNISFPAFALSRPLSRSELDSVRRQLPPALAKSVLGVQVGTLDVTIKVDQNLTNGNYAAIGRAIYTDLRPLPEMMHFSAPHGQNFEFLTREFLPLPLEQIAEVSPKGTQTEALHALLAELKLSDRSDFSKPSENSNFVDRLAALGAPAVPALFMALQRGFCDEEQILIDALGKIGKPVLRHLDAIVKRGHLDENTLKVISAVGEKDDKIFSLLAAHTSAPSRDFITSLAVAGGAKAIPVICEMFPLARENYFLEACMAGTLASFGKESVSAIPVLVSALNAKEHIEWSSGAIAEALCKIGDVRARDCLSTFVRKVRREIPLVGAEPNGVSSRYDELVRLSREITSGIKRLN